MGTCFNGEHGLFEMAYTVWPTCLFTIYSHHTRPCKWQVKFEYLLPAPVRVLAKRSQNITGPPVTGE